MVAVAAAAATIFSTTCMIIQGGGRGGGYPSKSMELRWVRSRSKRMELNPNPNSMEFGNLKSKPQPLTIPIYISTDPSHVNLQELSELYSSCNHSCNRFPVVDPNTGIVEETMDLGKLRIALFHSSVVVSVFCKPEYVNVSNTSKQIQNQEEQQKQMSKGLLGDLMERVMPFTPSDGILVGFGRAVSDMGLTASIYDVMRGKKTFGALLVDLGCDVIQPQNLCLNVEKSISSYIHFKVIPSLQGMGIGTIIVKQIVRMLTSLDIYDISALCSRKERFFFKACGFRDEDLLGATTMMYTRTVSTSSEGDKMVKRAGRKLLLVPPPRSPLLL